MIKQTSETLLREVLKDKAMKRRLSEFYFDRPDVSVSEIVAVMLEQEPRHPMDYINDR